MTAGELDDSAADEADGAEPGHGELCRPVPLEALATRSVTVEINATEAERRALAARFGILSVDRLKARVTLSPEGEEVILEGEIEAAVSQACVVTLEPVESSIASRMSVRYMSREDFAEHIGTELTGDDEEDFLTSGADDMAEDLEPLPAREIDVGEVVAQYLALALDPYPRKAGVAPGAADRQAGEDETRDNPFSVLKKLQDRG